MYPQIWQRITFSGINFPYKYDYNLNSNSAVMLFLLNIKKIYK